MRSQKFCAKRFGSAMRLRIAFNRGATSKATRGTRTHSKSLREMTYRRVEIIDDAGVRLLTSAA
jgi:hypothetical protein